MNFFTAIVALVVGVAAGIGAGFLLSKSFGIKNIENAKAQARAILREAAMAAEQMERHRITVLLVTDDAGHLVGAINTNDLMRAKVI